MRIARFHVMPSVRGGMGLYAARDFREREMLTVYTGTSLGKDKTREATAALEALMREGKAKHIRVVGGELIDGRGAPTAAQYINAGVESTRYEVNEDGKTARKVRVPWVNSNAQIDRTGRNGTISVKGGTRILRGSEIIMSYGQAYWRTFAAEREGKLPEGVTEEQAPTAETATAQTGTRRMITERKRGRDGDNPGSSAQHASEAANEDGDAEAEHEGPLRTRQSRRLNGKEAETEGMPDTTRRRKREKEAGRGDEETAEAKCEHDDAIQSAGRRGREGGDKQGQE